MQANGGEILRLAACQLVNEGIEVCALIHDAIMIITPTDQLERATAITIQAMNDASAAVLDGFVLRVERTVASYPCSYVDPDGIDMWERLCQLMREANVDAA
jgi:hypothetical protein